MYDKYMCILYAWITLINLLEEKHEYYGSCKINLGQLVSTDKMNCIQFGLYGCILAHKLFRADETQNVYPVNFNID